MNTIELNPGDSIQKALDLAPSGDLTLVLSAGVYKEKIEVNRKNVTLIGKGLPEIVFSDHHGTVRSGKVFSTGDSATFTVGAPNFKATGVKFSNSFDYIYWHEYNKKHVDKKVDTQAVAFRTVIGATNTILTDCIFSSFQDTLYLDSGKHYVRNSTIIGNIDFIFGAGEALFDSCIVESIGEGFVTAPSTFSSDEIGFVFSNCSFVSDAKSSSVYLARPWHPAGSINRSPMALFVNCNIGEHINKELWTGMNSRTPEGIERYWLPSESRFSSVKNSPLLEIVRKELDQA